MGNVIEVPQPVMTTRSKIDFCTEVAHTALLAQAKRLGLNPMPVDLTNTPDPNAASRQFKAACREILKTQGIDYNQSERSITNHE